MNQSHGEYRWRTAQTRSGKDSVAQTIWAGTSRADVSFLFVLKFGTF